MGDLQSIASSAAVPEARSVASAAIIACRALPSIKCRSRFGAILALMASNCIRRFSFTKGTRNCKSGNCSFNNKAVFKKGSVKNSTSDPRLPTKIAK